MAEIRGLEMAFDGPPARRESLGSPEIDQYIDDLVGWVADSLRQVAFVSQEYMYVQLEELNEEPDKPEDGLIVLADGTNWDPGSGAGYYGYQGGSWTFLG